MLSVTSYVARPNKVVDLKSTVRLSSWEFWISALQLPQTGPWTMPNLNGCGAAFGPTNWMPRNGEAAVVIDVPLAATWPTIRPPLVAWDKPTLSTWIQRGSL